MVFVRDNIFQVGKHKGKTVEEVQKTSPGYFTWLSTQPWAKADYSLEKYIDLSVSENSLTFGKYRGKTVSQIYEIDPKYLIWLRDSDFVKKNCVKILEQINKLSL